jgi:glycosyltransferase involved in cell wall biosynthesis
MKRPSDTIHFVVPGALDQATGGYRYDAAIVSGLRASGHTVVVHELAGRFPVVDGQAVAAARAARAKVGAGCAVIDGLALPAFAECLGNTARIVGLVHHPLWLESAAAWRTSCDLRRIEAALLPRLNKIVVTSRTTRRDVIALGVKPSSVAVVEPATVRGASRVRSGGRRARLLCVGTLTPRKAHEILFRALAYQRRARWRLLCVGSATRDANHARRLRALVTQLRLGKRVHFTSEVSADALARLYGRTDLFTLPSLHEGYGMAFAEAIARGVPVVGARAGAVPEVVPSQAGVLVRPGQVKALAYALRPLLRSSRRRERLARGAYLKRRRFPDWPIQVRAFASALFPVPQ